MWTANAQRRLRFISCWRAANDHTGIASMRLRSGITTRAAPFTLHIADKSGKRKVRLGADLSADDFPQIAVPAQAWQAAESTGDWTLVGCTVAPGFEFAKFELAPPDWEPEL